VPWYYEKLTLIPRIIEQTFQISVNPATETVQMRKTGGQHCSPGLDDYRLTSTTVHLERSNVWIIHTNELNYKEDNIQRPFHLQNYLDTLKYRVFKYPENVTLCPQAQCYFCFEKVTKRKVWQKLCREGVVLIILVPGKRFRKAVPACVLLRWNFRNRVLVRCVTKVPLL
jgi:hypothetical protein